MTAPQESYASTLEKPSSASEETAVKPIDHAHSATGLINKVISDLAMIRVVSTEENFVAARARAAEVIHGAIDDGAFAIIPQDRFEYQNEYVDLFIESSLSRFEDSERREAQEKILSYEALRREGLAITSPPHTELYFEEEPKKKEAEVEIHYSESDKDVTTGEKFRRIANRLSHWTMEVMGIASPTEPIDNTVVIKQLVSK